MKSNNRNARNQMDFQDDAVMKRVYGKNNQSEDDQSEYTDNSNHDKQTENNSVAEIISSANISPSDREKSGILVNCAEMRKDSCFHDITFSCQGFLIRAHKIIVSSWSRWLKSLLIEGINNEFVSLDVFSPDALNAVIDYMYGIPLELSVSNADAILRVVRRLEMHGLEQQCWKFLITVIDETNCSELQDLADRYGCPPLKLAAFRIIQENDPAYSLAPIIWDTSKARVNYNDAINQSSSGLTG